MVYAYDQNMQMPVKDLYDTQMMAIAINAAKDMYEKGLEQMDEFNKLYGDFYTPISKDMAAYNSLVIDPYKDAIDRLYANGIDPIRSAEGRAVLARIKNSVPIGKVNALKQSAETAKLYQKALGEAIASGKYDPDVDKFFNPVGLDNWDTLTMGAWNRPAPTTIKTIKEATSDWFDKRTPHDLTPEQMKAAGYKADPNYDYTGFLYDDLLKTAGNMTPGWQTSMEARYYRDQAKKQLEAAGVKDITPSMIEAQLQRNVAEANREYIVEPEKKANEFTKLQYQYNLQDRNAARAHNREMEKLRQEQIGGTTKNGKTGKGSNGAYSWLSYSLGSAISDATQYGKNLYDRQRAAIKAVRGNRKQGESYTFNPRAIVDKLAAKDYSDVIFAAWNGRSPQADGSVLYVHDQDNRRLKTAGELVADMRGVNLNEKSITNIQNDAAKVRGKFKYRGENNADYGSNVTTIVPTGKSVFYTDKYGNTKQFIEVNVAYPIKDKAETETEDAVYKYKKQRMYLDTEIQYAPNGEMTGNAFAAIQRDNMASKTLGSYNNKTESLGNPITTFDLDEDE